MWPNNNALEDTVEYGHCALYLHNIRRHCSYGTSPVDIGCGALRRAITRRGRAMARRNAECGLASCNCNLICSHDVTQSRKNAA